MIVSENKKPDSEAFAAVVKKANDFLNEDARLKEKYYLGRNGEKLEDDVVNALTVAARETPFEGSIVKVSGHKFPDIVAGKYFGVEVKSTKNDQWTTLGGSVNESTRVPEVGKIFVTFGKLNTPVEFKTRLYEDCLSEVVATHYPRYKIDMNLQAGHTIFDKMHTTYDTFCKDPNPVQEVVRYYRQTLKDGEQLWWMENGSNDAEAFESATLKVRTWRALTLEEKEFFISNGLARFPEIFGFSQTKYDNLALWLAKEHGVLSSSLRDNFSAGGKVNVSTENDEYLSVPRIFLNAQKFSSKIQRAILTARENDLKACWGVPSIDDDRLKQYVSLIVKRHKCPYGNLLRDIFGVVP